MITHGEVVRAEGVDGVEAVVIRHERTGHLYAVNASLSRDGSARLARAGRRLFAGRRVQRKDICTANVWKKGFATDVVEACVS